MRAVVQHHFGGPEVLHVAEVAVPSAAAGEVLVKVRAAGLNGGEVKVRRGLFPELGRFPLTLGSDLAGVVIARGEGVDAFDLGDEVFGMVWLGAYAEVVAVPVGQLAHRPTSLDWVHAAAVPVAGLTAWQGVVQRARVSRADRVLVHAAAGGVGHIAVQLGRLRGAYVAATARRDKHEFLRALGVDQVIDYTTTAFERGDPDYDVVLDFIGGDYGPRSLEALRPGGLLLGAAADPGVSAADAEAAGRRYERISVAPSGGVLRAIGEHFDTGKLRVHVAQTFRFHDAPEAHRVSERARVMGKLVLLP
jgi:NADPH:quinone reductase-like Zn-dependent oxidoreductase